jgi:hypothetical protein
MSGDEYSEVPQIREGDVLETVPATLFAIREEFSKEPPIAHPSASMKDRLVQ